MKRMLLYAAVLLVLFTGSSSAFTNSYGQYLLFPAGSSPEVVAIGDVNGDGRNDVVLASGFYFDPDKDFCIFVFLQNANGQLDPPIKYRTRGTQEFIPSSIVIGDVNNDGLPDIVVGIGGSGIEVFPQNVSGQLGPSVFYPTENSFKVKIGDFNNDGLMDVVGSGWGQSINIFFQDSGGLLSVHSVLPLSYPSGGDVDVGDVNNDGLTDIVLLLRAVTPIIAVLTQGPNGTFSSAVYYDLSANNYHIVRGVAVGDLNNDGLLDVAVTYGGNDPTGRLGVFYQNQFGLLNAVVEFQSYDVPGPIEIADVNSDGKNDVIVSHGAWSTMGVYIQADNGALLREEYYFISDKVEFNSQGLAIGDINRDGLLDVIFPDYTAGLIVLYHRKIEGDIVVASSSVTFDSIPLGQAPSESVIIYNEGAAPLILGTLTLTGQNVSQFSIKNDGCSRQTLPPWSACSVDIVFSSSITGSKEAILSVPSNDPDTPMLAIGLYGNMQHISPFSPYVELPVPGQTPLEAVAIGDVNGDGRNDIVVTTSFHYDPSYDYSLLVFLQNDVGQFDQPIRYLTRGSYDHRPLTVAIGDVNNDGRADVVVGNSGESIEVFLQNANGGLDPSILYLTERSHSVKIADLNNDGLMDVVGIRWGMKAYTNGLDPAVEVFTQNSNGMLVPSGLYYAPHGGWDAIHVHDLDNDGLSDILVMSGQSHQPDISMLFQLPGAGFSSPLYLALDNYEIASGAGVGDVNGDGLADIVVAYGGNKPYASIGIFHQSAPGVFDRQVSYESFDIPENVEIADIDGDGKNEIIVNHASWQRIGVYRQGSDGLLLPEELYPWPGYGRGNRQSMTVGDVNGDGHKDVVVAGGSSLFIFHHGQPAPRIALSKTLIDFGNSQMPSSAPQYFWIRNTGVTDLIINSITIDGVNAIDFRVDNGYDCAGQSIAPGGHCEMYVIFAPQTAGMKSATLSIHSNDPDMPVAALALRGDAILPPLDPNKYHLFVDIEGAGQGVVTSTSGGINCTSSCSQTYPLSSNGMSISLQATAAAGSGFKGWRGACSGLQRTCTVVIDSNKSVTAEFILPDIQGTLSEPTISFKNNSYLVSVSLSVLAGSVNTSGVTALLYLSDDAVFDANDAMLTASQLSFGALKPLRMRTRKMKITVPFNPSGKYLIAVFDPANTIREEDENNNIAVQRIP